MEKLKGDMADHLGVLLIGFDSEQRRMEPEVEELCKTESLAGRGWHGTSPVGWKDRRCDGLTTTCWVKCWFPIASLDIGKVRTITSRPKGVGGKLDVHVVIHSHD